MRLKLILSALLVCFSSVDLSGAETHTVSGYVVDGETGETIIGAHVVVRSERKGAATDLNGYFRITDLAPGTHILDVFHIGYEKCTVEIVLQDKGLVLEDISLQPRALEMEDIVVTEQKSEGADVEVETSHRGLTPKAIRSIPGTRGDVFRAIKHLPGIEGVDPISPLYSVRGGDPGENLILLDGVTIYNPYHFVTGSGLFNLKAIKNVDMLVGGFGAEFGGRNSSVLYITTREGNDKGVHGEIEPAITHTSAVFDFPVGKKATMMVSGRTYYNLVSRFLLYSPSYFYDMNISLNWKLSRSNRLSLRYFFSQDFMGFDASNYLSYLAATFDLDAFDDYDFRLKNRWNNQAATAILKTVLSPRAYLKTQVSGSFSSSSNFLLMDYEYTDDDDREKLYYSTDIRNEIRDLNGKSVLSVEFGPVHSMTLGGEFSAYRFGNDILINRLSEGRTTREPSLFAGFVEDKIRLGPLTFRGGMRFSRFSFADRWYREPRVNMVSTWPQHTRLRASWGKYYQYIISINSQEYELSQFLDYYYPLKSREPSASTHYVLGLDRSMTANTQLSIDVFHKDISRVYTFDYNISELEAYRFSDKLKEGRGKSLGVEFLWRGTWNRLSGWLSYGISKATRNYPHIMEGKTFLFDYDRTHSLKAMINHQVHPALSYSGTLRVMSGTPKTIETSTKTYFYYEPFTGQYASSATYFAENKNNARLPLFIRLDLGVKKRLRKGFGAELAEFLGAKESYLKVSFGNLLFPFHRNVWFYLPTDDDKMYGLGTNYFPSFSTGYTIEF